MNLSQEQYERIEEYGHALTPIADVAVLLGLDADELRDELADPSSDVHKRYHSGRAKTEYEIRSMEINMAVNGSPLAIQHVQTYIAALTLNNE